MKLYLLNSISGTHAESKIAVGVLRNDSILSCIGNSLVHCQRLLSEKPTSYRKQEVLKLENQLTESSELDRIEYQEKIMRARNTGTIFKHLKSLKKSPSLPKLLIKENQQSTKMQEQVNMMNEFFHSEFSLKIPFSIQDVKLRNPEITNFEISKKQSTKYFFR